MSQKGRTMSARIAYFRVSTKDQSIEAQKAAMGGEFDNRFEDEGVSGAIPAAQRPGFAKLLEFIRTGDTLCVYAVDRLGRDSIDIQTTINSLQGKGVRVEVHGLGVLVGDAGKLIMVLMAQLAEMERKRIFEKCESGRLAARASLAITGKTHKGKVSLGRPVAGDPAAIMAWKTENKASIAQTAVKFGMSVATIKRYAKVS